PGEPTLPALLKGAGYATGVGGKWHARLGGTGGPASSAQIHPAPLDIAFDACFIRPATARRLPWADRADRRVPARAPTGRRRVPRARVKGTSKCGTRGDVSQESDWPVGEVLAALTRLKLADDTLVIVTSDNGGVMDDGYEDFGSLEHKCNGPLNGRKGTLLEG